VKRRRRIVVEKKEYCLFLIRAIEFYFNTCLASTKRNGKLEQMMTGAYPDSYEDGGCFHIKMTKKINNQNYQENC
jgi:hypothetical protein